MIGPQNPNDFLSRGDLLLNYRSSSGIKSITDAAVVLEVPESERIALFQKIDEVKQKHLTFKLEPCEASFKLLEKAALSVHLVLGKHKKLKAMTFEKVDQSFMKLAKLIREIPSLFVWEPSCLNEYLHCLTLLLKEQQTPLTEEAIKKQLQFLKEALIEFGKKISTEIDWPTPEETANANQTTEQYEHKMRLLKQSIAVHNNSLKILEQTYGVASQNPIVLFLIFEKEIASRLTEENRKLLFDFWKANGIVPDQFSYYATIMKTRQLDHLFFERSMGIEFTTAVMDALEASLAIKKSFAEITGKILPLSESLSKSPNGATEEAYRLKQRLRAGEIIAPTDFIHADAHLMSLFERITFIEWQYTLT